MNTFLDSPLDNKSVIELFFKTAATGDLPTLLEILDESFVAHIPEGLPWGGVFYSREDFIKRCVPLLNQYIDFGSVTFERIFAEHEFVQVLLSLDVYGNDERQSLSETWTVRDGKITAVKVFYFQLDQLINKTFA